MNNNYDTDQNDEETGIDPKQERMISALLTSQNASEACKTVNISRSTLARWMKSEEFREALRDAERIVIRNTILNLTSGTEYALSILKDLMTSSSSENIRRLAANDWLNHFYKVHEMVRNDDLAEQKTHIINTNDISLQ